MENTATGEFSAIITPPSGAVSVLLATDGTEPAPVVSLTWPVAVTTPYLVPLLVAGGVLLLAALALAWAGRRMAVWFAVILCLVLTVWLFLWEVWSPVDGFRMPWIDTRLDPAASEAWA